MPTEAPLELKKTVNLPKTDFAQKADLAQSEPARLKKWDDADLYNQIRRASEGREKFVLHDGPAGVAGGDLHLGAALNKILKDFVVRSRTMMGYDAPYVPGYDCHAPAVEQGVAHALEQEGARQQQNADVPVVAFRRACREHAAAAAQSRTREFRRLGILGRWDDPYLTMSNEYEAATARLFGRFVERGYAYRGAQPVAWCAREQTALAESEIEYAEHAGASVYVKFQLSEDTLDGKVFKREVLGDDDDPRRIFFIIWTTLPWTLAANLGLAVNPNSEYCAIENGDEVYIVASELGDAVARKCGLSRLPIDDAALYPADDIGTANVPSPSESTEPNVIAHFPGSRLDRLEARHPWLDRPSLVMVGEHVTPGGAADAETGHGGAAGAREKTGTADAGTGVVHIAPGHGHDDFVLGKAYGLDAYCPVDAAGRFTAEVEHFAGAHVFEAGARIVALLEERGALLSVEPYAHRHPHCRRCRQPVVSRATPQWFISLDARPPAPPVETDDDGRDRTNYTENEGDAPVSLREAGLAEIERVGWVPAWGEVRMRNALRARPDPCVSRRRAWGVPIPAFYCDGCGVTVADPQVIAHVAEIFARESSDAWYARAAAELLPAAFKCPGCGAPGGFTKETDTLDASFAAGASSFVAAAAASSSDMPEGRADLCRPADVYLEGGDQYLGWFSSSLLAGLAAHGRAPYRNVLTHGWTLDAQAGRAAQHPAESDGDDDDAAVSAPNELVAQFGAETLRLWCASSDYHEDMRRSPEIFRRVSESYRKIRNTFRFALGNLDGFDPARDAVAPKSLFESDRWALAELDAVTLRALDAYEAYEFHTAYQTLFEFCAVTLSARYFDIVKDRLYTSGPKSDARRSAQTALYEIADALARLLSPLLVFTADEVWENLSAPLGAGERAASVHTAGFPVAAARRDEDLAARWAQIFEVREVALGALEEARAAKLIGGSLEARVAVTATDPLFTTLMNYQHELRYAFIVSQVGVLKTDDADAPDIAVKIFKADGAKCERCWNYSRRVGEFTRYPTACERCVEALAEIEAEGASV